MNIMKNIFSALFLLLMGTVTAFPQQKLKFSVTDFDYDAFDTTAKDDRHKKVDGSGSLYAIIKVTGNPDEDLREYNFNFGNMNSFVEDHDDQLWVYVQKNAKMVTISRNGYTTLRNYDLHTTIEAGKTYKMVLSAQGQRVQKQMVMFSVNPKNSNATVTITKESDGSKEVLGNIDETGRIAQSLAYGTYTYEVMARNYHSTEGRFTLSNELQTHNEEVTLRPNGAYVTLTVESNAEIYVDNSKMGTRQWTGMLKAGVYQVECRQANHNPSSQTINIEEGKDQTFKLLPPTPITGVLAVNSRPLGANINIDGKDYGTTPRNITDLLIGKHSLTLTYQGYSVENSTIEVKEQQTTDVNIEMKKAPVVLNTNTNTSTSTSSKMDELTFTVKEVSFIMKRVEGGTFQMGATKEQESDAGKDEKPVHSVTLSDYYIGMTEVTQALWQAVMGNNPSAWKRDDMNLPVEMVSWDDCQVFITKLNQLTGRQFRLPTEAEWEYAARGGKKSKGYKYSGSNNLGKVAWYSENSDNRTHEVAAKKPNELGLYDMSGNVQEWCQDWHANYESRAQTNPQGPSEGYTYRVFRGGRWKGRVITNGRLHGGERECRVSYRGFGLASWVPANTTGLRLALSK